MRGSSDIVVVVDWDGGWDCVGERDLKSVASLVFYIYLTYLTLHTFTLPYHLSSLLLLTIATYPLIDSKISRSLCRISRS